MTHAGGARITDQTLGQLFSHSVPQFPKPSNADGTILASQGCGQDEAEVGCDILRTVPRLARGPPELTFLLLILSIVMNTGPPGLTC